MWRSVFSIPSPRGLAPSTRDRLLRKLTDAYNRPIPTTFLFPLGGDPSLHKLEWPSFTSGDPSDPDVNVDHHNETSTQDRMK